MDAETRQTAYESIFGRRNRLPDGAALPVYQQTPYVAQYVQQPPPQQHPHPQPPRHYYSPVPDIPATHSPVVAAATPTGYQAIYLTTPHHLVPHPISYTVDPSQHHYPSGQGVPQLPTVELDHSGLGVPDYADDFTSENDSDPPWNRTPSPNGSRHGSRRGLNSASSSMSRNSRADVGQQRDSDVVSLNPSLQHTSSQQHHARRPSSPSAPTTSHPEFSYDHRRSNESSRTMPQSLTPTSATANRRSHVPVADRTRSLSTSTPRAKSISEFTLGASSSRLQQAAVTPSRRSPIVYPALLSRVAEAFKSRIVLSERAKDGLAYQNAFDGRGAVDKIAYIIKTTDRNLALLLGRALDAQKFFHDVTYDHRLRDSPYELYQFRAQLPSPFVSEEMVTPSSMGGSSIGQSPSESGASSATMSPLSGHPHTRPRQDSDASTDDVPLPSGVFTLLADCYSPTCTRDMLCYSIACPRRLEQQARLNMKPQPGLRRSISEESLGDYVHHEAGTLWIHSVPQEVVDSVSDSEKRRQEAINEVIYTERDFVKDMEYLRDCWVRPLQTSDIIPAHRRSDFIGQVFWNIHEIITVNTRLRDALNKRQKSYAIVETIGDIFEDVVPHFEPFVDYGSHQLYGKYEFEKEKGSNPAFAQFVDETERLPESRKLELNGYLTKPTTRLARYPLLLDVVLKHTPDDNPDKMLLVEVVKHVRSFLTRVNEESGKAENRFNLLQLDQQLVFRNVDPVDLKLREEHRQLLYKGTLKKRGGAQNENGDLQVFLFDHALLMVKAKTKHEQFRVYKRPIPLELLVVSAHEDVASNRPPTQQPKKTIMKRNSFSSSKEKDRDSTVSSKSLLLPISLTTSRNESTSVSRASGNGSRNGNAYASEVNPPNKNGYAITFMHLGRKGYVLTLWASTFVGRRKWLEAILKQQEVLRVRSMMFDTVTLSEGFFYGANKANCAVPFNQGTQVVYGTDNGIYFSDLTDRNKEPVQVLAVADVTQVNVLEEHDLLVFLSERSVVTLPLEALDPEDPAAGMKRAKRVASNTSFFKAGTCLGKTLVCVVKASALSSTIKTLVPIEQSVRGKNKPTFKKLLQGGNDTLRVFREFYIPTESSSIHFLKTKLCVGCTKGFEIVDLETLDTQGLLDPADASLDFVQKRENVKPIAIYRIGDEFLLCYDEFAFYVNRSGWRARPNWLVHWEGLPTSFALHYPFVLAFEPTFIEVRHVDTGLLIQVIPGNNLKCLFADTPPSLNAAAGAGYPGGPYVRGNPYINPYGRQMPPSPPHGPGPGYLSPQSNHLTPQQMSGYGQANPYQQQTYSPYSSQIALGGPALSMPVPLQINPYYQPGHGQGSPVHRSQAYVRDEIIIVSEDRVMCVRLAPPPLSAVSTPAPSETMLGSVSGSQRSSTLGSGSTTLH